VACATPQQNTAPVATTLSYRGIDFFFSRSTPDDIVIDATGTGETREIALNNALVAAVGEALGVFVVSEVSVENNRILRDIAINYTSGVVREYAVKECQHHETVRCVISAHVSPFSLRSNLLSSSAVTKINGEGLFAQHLTAQAAILQRKKLTDYFMSKLRTSGLNLKLKRFDLQPSNQKRVKVYFSATLQLDRATKATTVSFLKKLNDDTSGFNRFTGIQHAYPANEALPITIYFDAYRGPYTDGVVIYTFDANYYHAFKSYLDDDLQFQIKELNRCFRVPVHWNGLFTMDAHPYEVDEILEIDPTLVRSVREITLEAGCDAYSSNHLKQKKPS
jgi:hypothetical protein